MSLFVENLISLIRVTLAMPFAMLADFSIWAAGKVSGVPYPDHRQ